METMFTTAASLTPEEASSESCMTPPGEILREPRRPTPLLTMESNIVIGVLFQYASSTDNQIFTGSQAPALESLLAESLFCFWLRWFDF